MNSHDEVMEFLPWFVNGTLNERDQSMVNDHLRECDECNHEVEALIETAKLFHASTKSSADSFDRARGDFLQQLNENSQKKAQGSHRRWMIPTTLAACLVIAVLIGAPLLQRQESFQTLGNSTTPGGPVIQLVFQPDTTEKSIRSLVLGDHGHIVSGPTAQGVYRLELPPDRDPQWVLERLRNHPDVQFAALEAAP